MYIKKEVEKMKTPLEVMGIPSSGFRLNMALSEVYSARELEDRKLYLYGEIMRVDECEDEFGPNISPASMLVKKIMMINALDKDIPPEERKPIVLYINSIGGEVSEGFALVSIIEVSKTPVYTVNVGEWCSMAFLIGITGKRRFSLPYMTFLMHEASGFSMGKISNMEDKIDYDRKFGDQVIKQHILKHSTMDEREYGLVEKKELYMLPEDALKYGFIDEIVTDIDTIL